MKILITGGHVTPALAVIDELKGQEIVFVGRKYAVSEESRPSFEYSEIKKREIRFVELKTGRFTRIFSLTSLINIFKIPVGFVQALRIVRREKPDKVLTFGGYLGLPIAFWSYMLNIPVYTHEQTIVSGLANKLIGKIAKKVFLSFPITVKDYDQKKVIISGNPIRKKIFEVVEKPFEVDENLPTIFVSGGSLGSHSINLHIKNILQRLLDNYQVIHQTGSVKGENDIEHLNGRREQLPENLKKRYFLKEHFSEDEFGYIYSVSDAVVGRAGANTFFELIAVEKPAIFIPLPWSSGGEQQKQAELFKNGGCGDLFNQNDNSELLLEKIFNIFKNLDGAKNNFKNLKQLYKKDAARIIASEITKKD